MKMKLKTKRSMVNVFTIAGMATLVMAAAYAEGSRSSSIDNARNVEPAAQGRSAEGSMGMAMPTNVISSSGPKSARHVENNPDGTSLTRTKIGVGSTGTETNTQGSKDVTGEPSRQ